MKSAIKLKAEELNALHGNAANWHLLFFYFAPEDPRIVVRRHRGNLGWTLNFARPMALPFFGTLIAAVYGYMELLSRFDVSDTAKWIGIFLLFGLIFILCAWMSNPRRRYNANPSPVP